MSEQPNVDPRVAAVPIYDQTADGLVLREGTGVQRVVLVHLNIEVGPEDTRTADEISSYIDDALSVGTDVHEGAEHLTIVVALAEEI